ncbi:MAG TPA: hypothetical protein VL984_11275 [Acidimicrobiales bacterium]|nr:hypothetical protein [Acidimicrobiales bacterium]
MLRLLWAAALMISPQRVIVLLGGEDTRQSRFVGRILGARHLVQGVAEVALWPKGRRIGSLVDSLHAASAAAFAGRDPHWRRAAVTDAGIAASFAVAGAAVRRP